MSIDTLALIPARGGSKRVPRKNIQEVAGKPLIAHTIGQAKAAKEVDRAIISTDSDEIARVARGFDGDVPFIRPKELATDTAPAAGVMSHALDWAAEHDKEYDIICSLQVTSPLRKPRDIDGAITQLIDSEAMSCVSVTGYITPPQWAVTIDEEKNIREFFQNGALWDDEPARSQEIPELQHPNGAIFASTTASWRRRESFYTPKTVGYEMPPERSFDIDEPWELELIRTLIE
jgi:N-acylneuraminate cytidylyltransferase